MVRRDVAGQGTRRSLRGGSELRPLSLRWHFEPRAACGFVAFRSLARRGRTRRGEPERHAAHPARPLHLAGPGRRGVAGAAKDYVRLARTALCITYRPCLWREAVYLLLLLCSKWRQMS